MPKRDLVASLEVPFHKGSLKVAEGLVFWPAPGRSSSIFSARSTKDGPRLLRALARLRPRRPCSRHGARLLGHHLAPLEVADDPLDQRHEDGYSRPVRGPKRVRENCRAPSGMAGPAKPTPAAASLALPRRYAVALLPTICSMSLPCPSISTPYLKVQFRRRHYTQRGVN